jgi:hypothetical protein
MKALLLVSLIVMSSLIPTAAFSENYHPPSDGHEHGDAPPAWLGGVSFDGPFQTSAIENTVKHAGMKGVYFPHATAFDGTGHYEAYLRYHVLTNPMDRESRHHSFETWVYQPGMGIILYKGGWQDFGDPNDPNRRIPKECVDGRVPSAWKPQCAGLNTQTRPVVFTVSRLTNWYTGELLEQWYGHHAGMDLSLSIMATTFRDESENVSQQDPSLWDMTGDPGLHRELEITGAPLTPGYYCVNRHGQDGRFCSEDYSLDNLPVWVHPVYRGIRAKIVKDYPGPKDGVRAPN